MRELEVSAIDAVPPSRTAADQMTPAVIPSSTRPRDFGFTYYSGDTKSSWDTRAC
jgi:hypothetical protein